MVGYSQTFFVCASRTEGVEQRVVYSIYYKGTLVLPGRGERGVALAGCVWVRVE